MEHKTFPQNVDLNPHDRKSLIGLNSMYNYYIYIITWLLYHLNVLLEKLHYKKFRFVNKKAKIFYNLYLKSK